MPKLRNSGRDYKPITAGVHDALTLLLQDASLTNWFSLDGRARRVLLDRGYAVIVEESPVITEAGRRAKAGYEAREHNHALTLLLQDGLLDHWLALDDRSRRVLLEHGYVAIIEERPRLTEAGQQAASEVRARHPVRAVRPQSEPKSDQEIAAHIGLKKQENLRLTLSFIERTVHDRSLHEIAAMTQRAQIAVKVARSASEIMQKRRMLAALIDSGKLAQVLNSTGD